jgi:hypothetical protein
VTFTRINDAYQRLTAEPEDVELFTEYDEYEFPDLGPDFFFAFEGLGAGKGNAAAEFFRRCWNDLRSYTDDEFERTYHDYTNQRGRKGRRGAPKAEPRTNTGSRGRRKSAKAPADKKNSEPPRATEDDAEAGARRSRAWILSTLPPRPAMVRRDTTEVTLRVTKNNAFPSFPHDYVIERLIERGDFKRVFEVEVRKESDGPFRRASLSASGEDRDAKQKTPRASGTRTPEFSRREVFDASGAASGTVTVLGLEPGVRYRFRTRLGLGSENDVTWSEPGVESVYAAKRAPEETKSAAAKQSATPPQNASSAESSREPPKAPTPSKRASKDSSEESPHASPSSSVSDSAFATKKRAAPVSSRETALAAVAAAEAAERAAAAAKAEKKRADRLASMSSGERAAEAAREEAEAARARAEAEKQRLKAEARKEKKRLAAARAAEREREERANAAEHEREWAELYRAQFAAETAERDAQVAATLLSEPTREQARAARAAAFAAAAAEEDARAAAALKSAKSAEWVSEEEKAALREEECAAAARISAALAAADEAAKGTRFETRDASVGIPIPSSTSAAKTEAAPEIECPPVEALDTTTFVAAPAVSAAPSTAKPCRFWSGTGCRFGDACRNAHDGAGRMFAAPGTPVPATQHSPPGTLPGSSKAALSSSHVKRRAQAYKTKPCRYWTQKGTCPRGDACGFVHGNAPEHPGGTQTQTATHTARFASHSDAFCGVCRLPFDSEHELVEHLWSDAHRDKISDAFEAHEGE